MPPAEYLCPPSLSILSQPCPRWQHPEDIQILSDITSPESTSHSVKDGLIGELGAVHLVGKCDTKLSSRTDF